MSRIRSIHPGLWTDEAFVSLSSFARLLLMGLWNECDDKGTFVWSPVKMKMRILPADNVDPAELLAEIEEQGIVKRYEVNGKSFGGVRNFTKFQRPKKPNDIHPITAEIRAFVGMDVEPCGAQEAKVPDQLPTGGEKSPQREEGGGRMEEETNVSPTREADAVLEEWRAVAKPLGLSCWEKLTPKRRKAIKSRLSEHGRDGIRRAIDRVPKSAFLRGEAGNWNGANLDFMMRPDTIPKILEGQYDDRAKPANDYRKPTGTATAAQRAIASLGG